MTTAKGMKLFRVTVPLIWSHLYKDSRQPLIQLMLYAFHFLLLQGVVNPTNTFVLSTGAD